MLSMLLPWILAAAAPQELAPPFRVMAGGEPVDVEIGHAHPLLADLDGDGLQDLLVGQFGGGTCRVYRNVGTAQEPAFEGFELLQAGGAPAKVEAG